MAMFDQNDANAILNSVLGTAAYTAVTGTTIRLGSNTPNATTDMTPIAGSGYTPLSISWNAASGQSASNSGAVSWTNGSGGTWSILGIEIWDVAGTPKRHLWGTWAGGAISVISGNIFSTAAAAVTAGLV